MCGIVGISAQRDVVSHLISGLKALEYRGYDSAGIAVLTANGLDRRRAKGKVRDLETLQNESPLTGHSGIFDGAAIDATHVKAHRSAAGAKGGPSPRR